MFDEPINSRERTPLKACKKSVREERARTIPPHAPVRKCAHKGGGAGAAACRDELHEVAADEALARGAAVGQVGEHVVAKVHVLLRLELVPVTHEQLLESVGCHELRVAAEGGAAARGRSRYSLAQPAPRGAERRQISAEAGKCMCSRDRRLVRGAVGHARLLRVVEDELALRDVFS